MKNRVFIFSTIIFFTLISCKKYEDGPAFSLRSKKGRVANTWKIDQLFIDGLKQELTEEDKRSRVTLKKDGSASVLIVTDTSTFDLTGNWDFENKKEEIEVSGTYYYNNQPYEGSLELKILRLKEKELWLEYEIVNPSTWQEELIEAHYIPE